LVAAVVCGIVLLVAAGALLDVLPGLDATAAFWLGVVPVHFGALAAALAMWAVRTERSERLGELDLALGRRPAAGLVLRAAAVVAAFYPLSCALTFLAALGLTACGVPPEMSPILRFVGTEKSVGAAVSVIVTAVLLAPVAEELLFRLVLYEALRLKRVVAAGPLAALAFALLHGSLHEMPALFALGLVLQWTRRRYGTLWLPILVHAIFNAASLALAAVLYLVWGGGETF